MSALRLLMGPSSREAELDTHALHALDELNNMRLNGVLVDIELHGADGGRLSAHRALLAASTPYFRAMFGGRLRESQQQEVVINDVKSDTLRILVDYIYTGVACVNEDNVEAVLAAASLLQLEHVAAICSRFLLDHLDVANCLGIRALADMLGLSDLKDGADNFVERHFGAISRGEEFAQLSATALQDLLQRDRLVVRSETEVLSACVYWLGHDWPTRRAHSADILQHVRWRQLPTDTLATLSCNEELNFLREEPKCSMILERAQWGEWDIDHSSTVCRFSQTLQGVMFAIGGETSPGRRTVSSAEKFNAESRTWEKIADLSTPRRGAAAAILNNILYVIGGSDGRHALNSVQAYDPVADTWLQEEGMAENRSSVNAVVDSGVLYVAGGYNGISSCLNSVEKFTPSRHSGKWSHVAPMNTLRSMAGLGLLKRCVYAIGGYDGGHDLRSCERYSIDTNSWSSIADMSACR